MMSILEAVLACMQSYLGSVKEAVDFLKMTTLTATPIQLAKLGLVSSKAAKALQKTAATAASSHSPFGSASGDENLISWAADARHMLGELARSFMSPVSSECDCSTYCL